MKILSTEVTGFKAIEGKLSIPEFSDINIIFGKNYSGKTSLLSSLTMPLTGKRSLEKQLKIEDYINNNSDHFSIKQDMLHNEKVYSYFYKYSRKGAEKSLTVKDTNGEVLDTIEGVSPVDQFLALNISDPDLIANANISAQRSESDFLFQDKNKKLEIMRRILGLDTIDETIELCKKSAKELNKSIDTLQIEITALNMQELKLQDVQPIPEDYDVVCATYDKLKKEYDIYLKSQDLTIKFDTQSAILKDKTVNLTTFKSSVGLEEKVISELDSKLLNYKEVDENLTLVQNRVKGKVDFKNKLLLQQKDIEVYNESIRSIKVLKRQLEVLQSEHSRLPYKTTEEIKTLNIVKLNSSNTLKSEIETLLSKIQDTKLKLQSERNKLELAKIGLCDKCERPVENNPHNLQAHETTILELTSVESTLNSNLTEKKSLITSIESEIQSLNQILNDLSLNLSKQSSTQKEIETKESSLVKPEYTKEQIESELVTLETYLSQMQLDLDAFINLKKEKDQIEKDKFEHETVLKSISASILKLESEIVEIQNVIKQIEVEKQTVNLPLDFNVTVYESTNIKYQEYSKLMNTREMIVKQNEQIEAQIKVKNQMIADKTELIQTHTVQIDLDQRSVKLLQGYVAHRINVGLNTLIQTMNEFFINIHDSFEVKLLNDADIDIVYTIDNGTYWNSTYLASGLEKQMLAGAWKVALSKMQNIGILILDEPDDAAEEENSIKLLDAFVNQGFEQIFLITHRVETIEYLENTYGAKVFKMEKGRLVK